MSGAAYRRHQNDGVYRTPDDFREAVSARFGMPVVDLACSPGNQFGRLGVYWHSLAQDWNQYADLLWLNPPYNNIRPWAEKCAESNANILLLVPASVGSNWFRDYVFARARVYLLNGRMSFDGKHPYPKDLILCHYGDKPGFEVWSWKKQALS